MPFVINLNARGHFSPNPGWLQRTCSSQDAGVLPDGLLKCFFASQGLITFETVQKLGRPIAELTVRDTVARFLMTVRGVTPERAKAVCQLVGTPQQLCDLCRGSESSRRLSSLEYLPGKRIGDVLASRIIQVRVSLLSSYS
jgi:hypothetical protein